MVLCTTFITFRITELLDGDEQHVEEFNPLTLFVCFSPHFISEKLTRGGGEKGGIYLSYLALYPDKKPS